METSLKIQLLGRGAPASSLRQSVILAMCILWAAMAVLGAFELIRGYAGLGILLAILAETAFAVGYFILFRKNIPN